MSKPYGDSESLEEMVARAKGVQMSPGQREQQRRSFAFGNAKIENERVTREMVDQAADRLEKE